MSGKTVAPELLTADENVKYDALIVGCGVIGPCIATALARKGKKVLIVEKEWTFPERIVGELMQPGGVRALKSLGMVQAFNNIDAYPVTGYTVIYNGEEVDIPYPYKADSAPVEKLEGIVKDGNDKVLDDANIKIKDFEDDERERGIAFVHGKFLQNLRKIVADEPNVTRLQGTVIEIMKDDKNEVYGAKVDIPTRGKVVFKANLTFVCDGIFSRFRTELHPDHQSRVDSSFIGMALYNADMPAPKHGHVILGNNHLPIICYQISPEEVRLLCAYNSAKLPSDIKGWMTKEVQPFIPKKLRPSFDAALAEGKFKSMPNSYLPAIPNQITGLCVIGDALNQRHPLTGGGMTVGLQDVVLLMKKISDLDFNDRELVLDEILDFNYEKKDYGVVINVLSIALYALFAANTPELKVLQKGCFKYFQRGGDSIAVPARFLAGVLPKPLVLTRVFFAVAFYACYINIQEQGLVGFFQAFSILITAFKVFTPFLYEEMFS
ncbi:hypothetical protein TPHA_0E03160 [Tetrapisispora phaffii CBS 4417]|uniref:Squalene monooxygenase n=1 Tax=Tetrapisispora phaffii (strain ATCC 24235 / CBS 4417 / NBRC 1672 / NRRL Y-8282 / UCD 70-5) TaxID=1071381 RepID=G8BU28_TETPH|nr:hypothetical protein TPHA_0E03160 [Tetrapisispora phaffii CBS 4417]CCE63406.1 hypothetical protein TPHA_0E03160 [Tetrapisispora phaffii CBS 4417]